MPPNHPKQEPSGASELVLLVDDFDQLRAVFLRKLGQVGMFARGCPSALHALRVLEQREVAVLISDYHMAGPDGGRLLSLVRERYPRTRRVMLTGNPWALPAADRESAHRVIGKGTETEEVIGAIQAELEEWRRAG